MKVHYFQRYHQKENVMTANTMLLLSRLYDWSPRKFYRFLKQCNIYSESTDLDICFEMQKRAKNCIPDAHIGQSGFDIIIETKQHGDKFSSEQLERHLNAFSKNGNNVLLTIADEYMKLDVKEKINKIIVEYNNECAKNIRHCNIRFIDVVNSVNDVLDDRDFDMKDILADYEEYCYRDGLIVENDSWQFMRMQLAGDTFDYNVENGIYYDSIKRGFRPHDYLGLYKNKSIRAIGKLEAIIRNEYIGGKMELYEERGKITKERKEKILAAVESAAEFGYRLDIEPHRFFFVKEFYETDYDKETKYAPMGSRIFNLKDILKVDSVLPDTQEIANILKNKSWR